MLASYRKKKRYHRLRGGAFVDLEDFDLSQLDRLASDLGITQKELASGVVELPSFRAFYLDEEQNLDRDRSFAQYLENFHRVNETDYSVPEGLTATLRPYQVEGFRWLSARVDAGFGGILADEMGLGKSVQLISLLVARAQEARGVGPSLIVCPSSLVYNWLAEFEGAIRAGALRCRPWWATPPKRPRRSPRPGVFRIRRAAGRRRRHGRYQQRASRCCLSRVCVTF